MKKIILTTVFPIAIATGIIMSFRKGHTAEQSQIMLENIEALTDVEGEIEIDYYDNCISEDNEICCKTPFEVHWNSRGVR